MKRINQDVLFDIVNYALLCCTVIAIGFPLLNIVARSFSSTESIMKGSVWLWPTDFSLDGYRAVFTNDRIWMGYINSVYYTIVGTLINVVLTLFAAYPLSRKDFFGRNFIMKVFVFTILFSGGLIPTYLVVKDLGMLNTRWALLIPNAMVVYNVIVTRTFFMVTIPNELLEASQLDGCSDFRFVFSVVVQLSTPILAVISLWYAVGHWNSFFNALIYIKNQALFPLQIVLRNILLMNMVQDMTQELDFEDLVKRQGLEQLLKYSLIIVASGPVLMLYPLVQKYFVKGVLIGSVKG